jgi:hypothetical protein
MSSWVCRDDRSAAWIFWTSRAGPPLVGDKVRFARRFSILDAGPRLGDVEESAKVEDPSVVAQNAESSEVDFFEQPRHICGVGNVGPDRDCLTPLSMIA